MLLSIVFKRELSPDIYVPVVGENGHRRTDIETSKSAQQARRRSSTSSSPVATAAAFYGLPASSPAPPIIFVWMKGSQRRGVRIELRSAPRLANVSSVMVHKEE